MATTERRTRATRAQNPRVGGPDAGGGTATEGAHHGSPALTERRLLGAIMLLAVLVAGFNLWQQDWYTDPYFAAAVKSMLLSAHNFFYLSFDPVGFVSVDKPPLVLWLQAAVARILGYRDLSLLLPEAVAGVLSVWLLYRLVRPAFGVSAAALAAVMLIVTPINVAVNRDNNMDSVLVAVLLAAAWAATRAAESGRLRPLLACAALIGLGVDVKMLQVAVVLPALLLLYIAAPAPGPWGRRLVHLALAALVALAVALPWFLAVDLTPAAQRPYVGSSSNNTELDLLLGYNGLGRLLPGSTVAQALGAQVGNLPGDPGPLRLFDAQLGGQLGWLLPLALLGGGAAIVLLYAPVAGAPAAAPGRGRREGSGRGAAPATTGVAVALERVLRERRRQSLILWGGWLLTQGALFSVASYYHPYNLVTLTPAICALAGIGVLALWRAYGQPGRRWWLPTALVATALAQVGLAFGAPDWGRWLTVPLLLAVAGALVGLARPGQRSRHRAAAALGVGALLLFPVAWASVPLWHYGNVEFPVAGPDLLDPSVQSPTQVAAYLDPPTLQRFLIAHRHGERYLVAAPLGGISAPLMVQTGRAVLTFGGYLGVDHILSAAGFAALVRGGAVRYVWLLPPGALPAQEELAQRVRARCAAVPARLWQPIPGYGPHGPTLYDCRGRA